MRFVEVLWWDAFAIPAWTTAGEMREKLDAWKPEKTRGYLVSSDGEALVLAMNDSDPFLNCQIIPKSCVERLREIHA